MPNKISQHQPTYERGVYEFQEIARVEDGELNLARLQKDKILANQFVLTADEDGIAMFEKIYGIVPKAADTIQFRRERILNRMQLQPPYTERFLRAQLDRLLGAGTYTLVVDYANYIIYINYSTENEGIAKEVQLVINKVKPANMAFVTEQLLVYGIFENEVITSIPTIYYKLGTSWILGKYPFNIRGEGEVFKLANVNSITNNLLSDTANFVMNEISKVVLNESVEISNFTVKQVSNNTVEIEYEVTPQQVSTITRLQLCKADDTILTDATVYVPILDETVINHKIQVKEGV